MKSASFPMPTHRSIPSSLPMPTHRSLPNTRGVYLSANVMNGGRGSPPITTPPPLLGMHDSFDMNYDSVDRSLDFGNYGPISTTTKAPTCTYGKLILFSKTHTRGEFFEIETNLEDFGNFDNKVGSIRVEGDCCWNIFIGKSYSDLSISLRPGEYGSAVDIKIIYKKASSAKMYSC